MNAALLVFMSVVLLNIAGLALDAVLWFSGAPTVTAYVRVNQLAGVPLVVLQGIGAVALAVHFWGDDL
jgi:hypothetical protein